MPPLREVRLSEFAEEDYAEILSYTLERWGIEQLDRYTREIFDALQRLAEFPYIGTSRSGIRRGLYAFPIGQHVVFYEVHEDHILVRRILHRRRRPARTLFSGHRSANPALGDQPDAERSGHSPADE